VTVRVGVGAAPWDDILPTARTTRINVDTLLGKVLITSLLTFFVISWLRCRRDEL
jgi:hypothetical protein